MQSQGITVIERPWLYKAYMSNFRFLTLNINIHRILKSYITRSFYQGLTILFTQSYSQIWIDISHSKQFEFDTLWLKLINFLLFSSVRHQNISLHNTVKSLHIGILVCLYHNSWFSQKRKSCYFMCFSWHNSTGVKRICNCALTSLVSVQQKICALF